MKKRYLGIFKELKKLFSDDDDAMVSLNHLEDKVKDLPEKELKAGEYPLPDEISNDGKHFAVFSDGACRGNPGPGAWGSMGQDSTGKVLFESSGLEMLTTNNIMEMTGAIEALKVIKDDISSRQLSTRDDDVKVYLYSDSKYVVDGLQKWVPGWKSRGWKKADKKPPENLELWQSLDELSADFSNLSLIWVKGHAGHPQNERCDELANLALDEAGL